MNGVWTFPKQSEFLYVIIYVFKEGQVEETWQNPEPSIYVSNGQVEETTYVSNPWFQLHP